MKTTLILLAVLIFAAIMLIIKPETDLTLIKPACLTTLSYPCDCVTYWKDSDKIEHYKCEK